MKQHIFKVDYKDYGLIYTDEQKRKIDYMNDFKRLIKTIRHNVKIGQLEHKDKIYTVHYVASAIDNYSYVIKMLNDRTFIICDIEK